MVSSYGYKCFDFSYSTMLRDDGIKHSLKITVLRCIIMGHNKIKARQEQTTLRIQLTAA